MAVDPAAMRDPRDDLLAEVAALVVADRAGLQAGLDRVERQVDEVMFIREPQGRRLQVSVGAHSTVIMLDPIVSFTTLHGQLQRVASVGVALSAHPGI